MKRAKSGNTRRVAILLPALFAATAWAQEVKLPNVVVTDSKSSDDPYRAETVYTLGPLGSERLLDIPNSIAILPAALIENVQVTSVRDVLKYLPLTQFQEQQGSEVLRPATRGMMGSNYQNTRLDGMTIFVTGANALERLQQIEVFSGVPASVYGPAPPAGMFNFVSKRPTSEPLQRLDVDYDSSSIFTAHADLSGKLDSNGVLNYRVNVLEGHGTAFVSGSELDRKQATLAIDFRPSTESKIEFNYGMYDLIQRGYPGWFTYGEKIALPSAPDPTKAGLGQSYAGVDLKNQDASLRFLRDFGPNWHLVLGGLVQSVNRNINTPVNNLTDNNGDYTSSLANGFAPFFGITSDIGYLNGTFNTGDITHDFTLGTTGFRAISDGVLNAPSAKSILLGSANISDPMVFAEPAAGLPDVTDKYTSSIATQQGVNISDTIGFTKQWSIKLALSQDWMGTKNYAKTGALTTTYEKNGLSPMPSLIYKPRENITTYITYASSLQQGDVAPAGSANANQALAPYRSDQWELGAKAALSKIDLTFAVFRLERPFANVDPTDNTFKISGRQVNTGAEVSAIGKITDNLRIFSGITILNPELEATGNPATNNMQYVGMPKVRSNILLEYWVPSVPGFVVSFDWQYVGRRPVDDTNAYWTPSYNVFDLGARYTTKIQGKTTTWRVALNNIADEHYWSTIGPSNITGTNTGNLTAHLGAPRTVAASVTIDF
jgi:iron complex outermembrane recepter protein